MMSEARTSLTSRDIEFRDAVLAPVDAKFDLDSRPHYRTLALSLVERTAAALQESLEGGDVSPVTRHRFAAASAEAVNVVPLDVIDAIDSSFLIESVKRWPSHPDIVELAARMSEAFYRGFWPDEPPAVLAGAARFGNLANSLPAPIFTARADGRITFSSYALDELLGLIPGEAESYTMSDLFGTRLTVDRDVATRVEIPVDGVEVHLLVTVVPVDTNEGLEYFGFCDDVTREHTLEQMKDGVMTAISHQLRTPLTGIIGYLELLNEGSLDTDEAHEAISIAFQESEELLRLVRNIVEFSKLTAGTAYVSPQPIRLVSAVDTALRGRFELGGKPAVDIPFDLVLDADEHRLDQLMNALLDNAIQHGGENIEVSARRRVAGVELTVRDDGDGIAPAVAHEVTKPLVRAFNGGDQLGVGLGLAIAQGVMLCHGGTLTVENDDGAVITAWFPRG